MGKSIYQLVTPNCADYLSNDQYPFPFLKNSSSPKTKPKIMIRNFTRPKMSGKAF